MKKELADTQEQLVSVTLDLQNTQKQLQDRNSLITDLVGTQKQLNETPTNEHSELLSCYLPEESSILYQPDLSILSLHLSDLIPSTIQRPRLSSESAPSQLQRLSIDSLSVSSATTTLLTQEQLLKAREEAEVNAQQAVARAVAAQNQLIELQADYATLLEALETKQKTIRQLTEVFQSQEASISELRQSIAEKDGGLVEKEKVVAEKKKQLAQKEQEVADLVSQRDSLQEQVNRLTNILNTERTELGQAPRELDTIELTQDSLVSIYPSEYCEMSIVVHEGMYSISLWCDRERSMHGIRELQRIVNEYESEVNTYQKNAECLEQEIDSLSKEENIMKKRIRKMETLCKEFNVCLNEKERELGACYRNLQHASNLLRNRV